VLALNAAVRQTQSEHEDFGSLGLLTLHKLSNARVHRSQLPVSLTFHSLFVLLREGCVLRVETKQLGSGSRVIVGVFDELARGSDEGGDERSFEVGVVTSFSPDDVLDAAVLELPLLKLIDHVLHDEAKFDIGRFVPLLVGVPLSGEVIQVDLAVTVRAAGQNLCDKFVLVLVKRKYRLKLTMLSSSRIDRASGTILESNAEDVMDVLIGWRGGILCGVAFK
jgi:hypothetical protein